MSRELAFGVVGLGFGAKHVRVLGETHGARLAAVCDTDAARLAAVSPSPGSGRGKGRDVRAYTDYKAMLCAEQLDAVVVAVPARLHEEVALAAVEAGCAVLVEKPLAPSLAEGRRLVDAAAAAGVKLMPGHVERFNPALQELVRRVRAGEIGRVWQLAARRVGPIVVRAQQDVNVIHDSAVHDVDAMRWVVGGEVERVYAEAQSGLIMPFEDSVFGLLRFDSGAAGSLDVNWLSPRPERSLSVLGEKGMLVAEYTDFRAPALELRRPGTSRSIAIPLEAREPLAEELRAFVAVLLKEGREEAPLPVTGEDALAALAVCDALTQSARTGLPVAPARWR